MVNHYHSADLFRWHLNVFLKALKEVPQLIRMAMQHEEGFKAWFRRQRQQLRSDPLISVLFKKRDFIVHQDMLLPQSKGSVGITEGRGFKLGMTARIEPLEDSDEAMRRYAVLLRDSDFLGLTTPDEESVPCVHREWRLQEFDEELVDLCARAWLRVGATIVAVLRWQGAEPPPLSLECLHDSQRARWKRYDRDALIEEVNAVHKTPEA